MSILIVCVLCVITLYNLIGLHSPCTALYQHKPKIAGNIYNGNVIKCIFFKSIIISLSTPYT